MLPGIAFPFNLECVPPLDVSPPQRKWAMSRTPTPPPLPRPPPTGPLLAVLQRFPPFPPVHPLLSTTLIHSVISSPARSTMAERPRIVPLHCLLRLPEFFDYLDDRSSSWVNSVRTVLPGPPASPTQMVESLTDETSPPTSNELGRHATVIHHFSGFLVQTDDIGRVESTLRMPQRAVVTMMSNGWPSVDCVGTWG
ncbi:hypothetical protein OG21DRAFT_838266 [Imleria badia]|nr:hypothetical protein OG21DRAFT_838266 [Imleria badia]